MDGGYVCAELIACNPVLSFGAGTNIDFEIDLAELGHNVVVFDHTIDSIPKQHSNLTFHKNGIGALSSPDGIMLDLLSAIRKAGFDGRSDLFLKIDVEGFELEVFSSCDVSVLAAFEQIVMEVHWLTRLVDPIFRKSYNKMMHNLLSEFVIFHVHGNNCGSLAIIGGGETDMGQIGGLPILDVVEISLIRKDLITSSQSTTTYPTPLDFPNHPQRPDHIMSFFPFLPTLPHVSEQIVKSSGTNDDFYSRNAP